MRLPRFLRKFTKKAKDRKSRQERTIASIEALGFKVRDLRGWHEGKYAYRNYELIDPEGNVLKNGDSGFASSNDAYIAAKAAVANRR